MVLVATVSVSALSHRHMFCGPLVSSVSVASFAACVVIAVVVVAVVVGVVTTIVVVLVVVVTVVGRCP